MTSTQGFPSLKEQCLPCPIVFSTKHRPFVTTLSMRCFSLQIKSGISTKICNQNPSSVSTKYGKSRELGTFRSVEVDRFLTSEEVEGVMSEGFFEAIEELERMSREPSDILEEMNDRLSSRELQLVLVYFSQEGRDSWCALEVFEWLKKENRVDEETMELMVSIMCSWLKKLIEEERKVTEVVDLLIDMDCVGLKPGFSMVEKVISLYWGMQKRDGAISFVKEVLRRGITYSQGDVEEQKGGPTGFLAWKMMADGDYKGAVDMVTHMRESGLKPEVYSYVVAMTAVVKDLNELSKALRKLKSLAKKGTVAELDEDDVKLIENYQSDLISSGLKLSNWAMEGGRPSIPAIVHERLLAMYICAGWGLDAERQLWQMKLLGKEPEEDLYDIVLAICASQNEMNAVSRLLSRVEITGHAHKKKTLLWLLRGYLKGGHFGDAAKTLVRMLDAGLCPEYLDRAAVLQGLRKTMEKPEEVESYMNLCKRLSEAGLIGPSLLYLYKKKYNMWIVKML